MEKVLAGHGCDWGRAGDWDCGRCGCGLGVASELEWVRHADRAVASALWTPGAEVIRSVGGLELLAPGSTILARPGPRGQVYRQIAAAVGGLAWRDLRGIGQWPMELLPALVLERGRPVAQAA